MIEHRQVPIKLQCLFNMTEAWNKKINTQEQYIRDMVLCGMIPSLVFILGILTVDGEKYA